MIGTIQVVVGGQFGSEGKGAVAGYLARGVRYAVACRVGGPNAGHTIYDDTGRKWTLQQVPTAAVTNNTSFLVIGAGSEIDPVILDKEVRELDAAGFSVSRRLLIDPSATIITAAHAMMETNGRPHGESGLTAQIGSTGKGVGAARSDRIWRSGATVGQTLKYPREWPVHDVNGDQISAVQVQDTTRYMSLFLSSGGNLIIEGTQGYGLGLHTRFYPYVTSGDCRAIDFLAQAGVSPWAHQTVLEVWVVFRTYPIRVAGNSGPLEGETSWEAIGQDPEFTTVTKKQRRIGEWDGRLAQEAMYANGAPRVNLALTFLDYWYPTLRDCDNSFDIMTTASSRIKSTEAELGKRFSLIGTGPNTLVRV